MSRHTQSVSRIQVLTGILYFGLSETLWHYFCNVGREYVELQRWTWSVPTPHGQLGMDSKVGLGYHSHWQTWCCTGCFGRNVASIYSPELRFRSQVLNLIWRRVKPNMENRIKKKKKKSFFLYPEAQQWKQNSGPEKCIRRFDSYKTGLSSG